MAFPDKQKKLLQLIRTPSAKGDVTVADILCKRYASLWDVERIKEELGSSAHASFDGAQQLSMVEGISNLFLSSFVNYLAWAAAKLLRDANPEQLNKSKSILHFFWGMLDRMDIPPLHELKLLNPVWNVAIPNSSETFPFFATISLGIGELVEAAIQEKAPELDDLQQVRKWQAQELIEVAETVQAKLADDHDSGSGSNALLRWVEEQSHDDDTIWSAYLDHYMAIWLGAPQSTVGQSLKAWLLSRVPKEIPKSLSLLHLMVRKHHLELSTLAMSLRPTATLSRAIEGVEFSLKSDEIVVSIVEAFAVALTHALPAKAKLAMWLQAFAELVEWLQTIELRSTVKADQVVRLTCQLDELSTMSAAARALPNDQTVRMLETLKQGKHVGLRATLEVAGVNLETSETMHTDGVRSFVMAVLRWYYSPWRMRQQVMDIDEIEPFLALIAHDQIPRGDAVSLLRLLLQHYGSDSQERHAALGYSMAVMQLIGRRLPPGMIYAPRWLLHQGRESSSHSDSIANVLIAVIVKKTFDDRSGTDCAQLATQVQQATVRAARMRTRDPSVAPIDAIVLVVDRMALVARLAADFADEQTHPGQIDALRGTDAQRIIRALDEFIEDERLQWREFFFDCISRRAGTAKVHELLTAPQSRLA
jgi:hypothetical protein